MKASHYVPSVLNGIGDRTGALPLSGNTTGESTSPPFWQIELKSRESASKRWSARSVLQIVVCFAAILSIVPIVACAAPLMVQSNSEGQADVFRKIGQIRVLYAQTRYTEAISLARETLQQSIAVYGDDSDWTLVVSNLLGMALEGANKYEEAEKIFRHILAVREAAERSNFDIDTALNNLAATLQSEEKYEEAEKLFRRALERSPENPTALGNLGNFLRTVGRFREAEPLVRASIARLPEGSHDAAIAMSMLAIILNHFDQYAAAQELTRKAIDILEREGETSYLAKALTDYAFRLQVHRRYVEAEKLVRRAVAIDVRLLGKGHYDTGFILLRLGTLLDETQRYADAEPVLDESVHVLRGISGADYSSAVVVLGQHFTNTGQNERAEALFQEAARFREDKYKTDSVATAYVYRQLGDLYQKTKRYEDADRYLVRSLAIYESKSAEYDSSLAYALSALAGLRIAQDRAPEATILLKRAYAKALFSDDPALLWTVQDQLASAYDKSEPALATFFGKQAIGTIQDLRIKIGLDDAQDQAYLSSQTLPIYKRLADRLIGQDRLPEAEQTLSLLKQQELREYLRGEGDQGHARVALTQTEARVSNTYKAISERTFSLAAERAELLRIAAGARTSVQRARLAELDKLLDGIRTQVVAFMEEASNSFRVEGGQAAVNFGKKDLEALDQVQNALARLERLGKPSILVHYLVTQEKIGILVTNANAQVYREVKVQRAELNNRIKSFRDALQDPNADVRPAAGALYSLLIKPIENDLRDANANGAKPTLLVSLDARLRYVPFSALYDGSHWLIEKYPIAVYTDATRADFERLPKTSWNLAALGVSKAEIVGQTSFDPLPSVVTELDAIVKDDGAHTTGVLPGVKKVDEGFTPESFVDVIRGSYAVIHIASHFHFNPASEDDSFLLLGGNKSLSLEQLRKGSTYRFEDLDLLTLSACDTAMGTTGADGKEVESLGALAQERGARGVLATLWSVTDTTTAAFMARFYELREQQNLTKAEALRQAQREFIDGKVTDGTLQNRFAGDAGRHASSQAGASATYRHPKYWAPFILMGNWL